MLTKGLSHKF